MQVSCSFRGGISKPRKCKRKKRNKRRDKKRKDLLNNIHYKTLPLSELLASSKPSCIRSSFNFCPLAHPPSFLPPSHSSSLPPFFPAVSPSRPSFLSLISFFQFLLLFFLFYPSSFLLTLLLPLFFPLSLF